MKKIVFFAFLLAAFSYFGHPTPLSKRGAPGETLDSRSAAPDMGTLSGPAAAPAADGNDAADAAPPGSPGSTV